MQRFSRSMLFYESVLLQSGITASFRAPSACQHCSKPLYTRGAKKAFLPIFNGSEYRRFQHAHTTLQNIKNSYNSCCSFSSIQSIMCEHTKQKCHYWVGVKEFIGTSIHRPSIPTSIEKFILGGGCLFPHYKNYIVELHRC